MSLDETLHIPPDLAGVISKEDVFRKGHADFVAWARIANYLHRHAPGWQVALRSDPSGQHVWKAPNGTAYLVLYFVGPDGTVTEDFPYAITDNRNNPIQFEQVNARMLTDSHRRGFCAAAAMHFGLAYELWAKEEVDAAEEPAPVQTKPAPAKAKSAPAKAKAAPATPAEPAAERLLSTQEKEELNALIMARPKPYIKALVDAFAAEFKLEAPVAAKIQTQQHAKFIEIYMKNNG